MALELLTGLAMFSLVSSITPGTNNLMLMASGANSGFRRTLPHMLGVGLGFTGMVVLVGIGLLGQQLQRWLTSQRRLVAFNVGMASLLVLSLYPVVLP